VATEWLGGTDNQVRALLFGSFDCHGNVLLRVAGGEEEGRGEEDGFQAAGVERDEGVWDERRLQFDVGDLDWQRRDGGAEVLGQFQELLLALLIAGAVADEEDGVGGDG
jgi:hypothetical protein